jgi:hypothetical protein
LPPLGFHNPNFARVKKVFQEKVARTPLARALIFVEAGGG